MAAALAFESPAKRPRWESVPGTAAPAGEDDQVCHRYATPEGCPYGDTCRFRHGPSDERNLNQGQGNSGERKTRPCTKFFSVSGCPYGDTCHFLHFVPGGYTAPAAPPSVGLSSPGGGLQLPGSRPPPGSSSGGGGYKTRLCNRYQTPEGCRFGDRCHFAHGEADLRSSHGSASAFPSSYPSAPPASYQNGSRYGGPGYPSQASPQAAAISGALADSATKHTMVIPTILVGAVIGKAGANVKQISRSTGARVTVREHETEFDKRTVELEGSTQQIEAAVSMVQAFILQREAGQVVGPGGGRPATGMGAHNFKTKICDKYMQGMCTYGERCHFAHGPEDVRQPVPY